MDTFALSLIAAEFAFPIFVIAVILALIIRKIVNKKKREKQFREKAVAQEKERQNILEKFENNALVQQWAKTIAGQAKALIEANPFTKMEFQVIAYNQCFEFGLDLQQYWWELTSEYSPNPESRQLYYIKFIEHNLPDLTSDVEREEFSHALCNLAKNALTEKKYFSSSKANCTIFGWRKEMSLRR